MSGKRRSIPPIPNDPRSHDFNRAVKETLEVLRGERSGRIRPLAADASNADIVAKLNELLAHIQP